MENKKITLQKELLMIAFLFRLIQASLRIQAHRASDLKRALKLFVKTSATDIPKPISGRSAMQFFLTQNEKRQQVASSRKNGFYFRDRLGRISPWQETARRPLQNLFHPFVRFRIAIAMRHTHNPITRTLTASKIPMISMEGDQLAPSTSAFIAISLRETA